METDCKLLCATVTAAKGFVRQSVGDQVSEERVNVISAAYSLVGKVGYFWGGKSTVLGEDPNWGTPAKVSAEGSKSTGTLRAYGLDCSGFVTWAVINGYENPAMQAAIGDGTSDQWEKAKVVSEAEAQPGDLVFQRGPEAGSDNHVGIICGKTDAGDWIAVHCSSGKNGVTVGEAYSASFRYIRQPAFYPTREELNQMIQSGSGDLTEASSSLAGGKMVTSSSLQDVIGTNSFASKGGSSLLEKQPLIVDDNDIEVFVQP
ncbi:protein containing NLP/P60 domain protein [gut metagenome]|uniref:Protein containing NLP/P60 domain protein n=1 Tax=gut metagenome TaxID=749906 RepID=J9GMA5_9ZZZZ